MRSMISVLAMAALLVSSCGNGDDTSTATSVDTTSPSDAISSTTEPTATSTVLVGDRAYFAEAPGLRSPVLDVVAPTAEGTWPIVVTFHPDAAINSKSSMSSLAASIAEEGAVVFNPSYGGPGTTPGRSADGFRTAVEQATCAVWYAIEHADEYGGDPTDIRLVGFSGGANMATAVAMFPSDDDGRCEAPSADFTPSRVVAFEGDFMLGAGWDDVIRDDPAFYDEMTVWNHIPSYDGGPIHVLVDTQTRIAIDDVEEFLDLRHPDGPLRVAWEELGVIDDGRATLVQSNEMLHAQLVAAGHETTLTTIDALGHTLGVAAEEAIVDLVFTDD